MVGSHKPPKPVDEKIPDLDGEAPQDLPTRSRDDNYSFVTVIPFILTAFTFLATFIFQVYQNQQQNTFQAAQQRVQQDAAINSEWRKALEQVTAKDGSSAAVGAYEMVSFLGTKYGDQALAIAASLLPKIDSPLTFDVILCAINSRINQDNQNQLLAVDTVLVRDLTDLYVATRNGEAVASDRSFSSFLQEPAKFIDDNKHSDLLKQALTQIWELDSVSSALSNDWRGVGWGSQHATVRGQDLGGGIVLLNNDWRGIDFQTASNLEGVELLGKCKLDKNTVLPPSIRTDCHTA